jgi:S-DNA-T family DNA segregation ATPase FtsK/SpoIIIE
MPKGKRKKTTSSKSRRKQSRVSVDLAVVSMIMLSVLLVVLIYTNSGNMGRTLSPLLGGLMGWMKYILPIGTFAIAINLACEKNENLSLKLIQYAIFLICISVIMCVYQVSKGTIDMSKDIGDVLQQAYDLGQKNIGGGAIGMMATIPAVSMLGETGAVILAIGVAIIVLIFMFGIHPAQVITDAVENMEERRKERRLEDEEDYEEEEEEEIVVQPKKKEKLKKKKTSSIDIPLDDEQITINLNDKTEKLKKYDHSDDDITLLGMKSSKNKKEEEKKADSPNELENIFKTEQEVKEEKTKEVLVLEHTLTSEDEHYEFPPIELLSEGKVSGPKGGKKAIADNATKLQKTLYSFGVSAKVENVSVGPAITRYELKPAEGVRVSKIANLADDIALNLAAESIRIEAPIPGKQAVGIEVPNKETEMVHLRDILESDKFVDYESKLAFALGKDVAGNEVVTDIGKMPHVLIAGSTGSGKSVCINTLITSIIYKAKPSEVKLVMVDPKVVELSVYNGIPHLLIPVVTDPKKAAGALAWAVQEMVNRYGLFAAKGVRDIKGYNEQIEKEGSQEKLPQIVIIIDELADLMMVAAKDVEDAICRLAQMARAAGMHLVIATQRPSVDVITGIIKANIPSRIAFAVSSQVDSRTILDMVGAEKLLGKGDMLFYPSGAAKPTRLQGAFVSDKEVEKIVNFLKSNGEVSYNEDILESIEKANSTDKEIDEQDDDDDTDPFLMDAIETVVETGQASTSFIQRRFKVGYARAGRIIDQMEQRGIISGYEGSKPRTVLMSKERWQELKMAKPEETQENEVTE